MTRESCINALHDELLALVESQLTPSALRYGYSEVPLEATIKWQPMVLVIGNYSSGKSALINEFLGADIQQTGQAPTDDAFTILAFDDAAPGKPIRVTEERDGKFLLNDPEFPFAALKKHGQRFAAHLRLKKVNAPFLKSLALIDTPGMLDSITERDRGYNYQDVIGDLAQLADLVLVLFDAHKAGTVREAHISLRETLPARTFEDRVFFVLNRIDECASLNDLLRVYGTLCWNLSQITGRKDIPPILLTYSPRAAGLSRQAIVERSPYLHHLENQREDLKKAVMEAPRHRLDNLAAFVETHSERLAHMLEALVSYRRRRLRFQMRNLLSGAGLGLAAGTGLAGVLAGLAGAPAPAFLLGAGIGGAAVCSALWLATVYRWALGRFHRRQIAQADGLTPLGSQTRRDHWQGIKNLVIGFLETNRGQFPTWEAERDRDKAIDVFERGSRQIRGAINELAMIEPGQVIANPPGPFLAALIGESAADSIP
jgi:hypothetical protein